MSDDAELIEQTLAGRTTAFGQLVQEYQDRLYSTVLHVVGSPEDARDIAEEVFVQAFFKLDTFHRGGDFYAWLYRIAFDVARSHCRRSGVVAAMEPTFEELRTLSPTPRSLPPERPIEDLSPRILREAERRMLAGAPLLPSLDRSTTGSLDWLALVRRLFRPRVMIWLVLAVATALLLTLLGPGERRPVQAPPGKDVSDRAASQGSRATPTMQAASPVGPAARTGSAPARESGSTKPMKPKPAKR